LEPERRSRRNRCHWSGSEYESRNFLVHDHDAKACDLIVCRVHNWPECPDNLEVLELSGVVREGWRGGRAPRLALGVSGADC
jgi:hypothetical protein